MGFVGGFLCIGMVAYTVYFFYMLIREWNVGKPPRTAPPRPRTAPQPAQHRLLTCPRYNCRHRNRPGARFCTRCGIRLEDDQELT